MFFQPLNIIQLVFGRLVKLGREPDHGHALLARPQLVSRNNVASNRTIKPLSALRVASVECNNRRFTLKSHERLPADSLEVLITICIGSGIMETIARNVRGYWTKGTSRTTNGCLNNGVLSPVGKGDHL